MSIRLAAYSRQFWNYVRILAENMSAVKLFAITFAYICLLGFFIQLIFIPIIVPQWNAGDGILVGSLDATKFHSIATSLSERIKSEGWLAWELRPNGQSPAGIASVIYAIFVPKFWLLIPFNAMLHALAASALWQIMLLISRRRWISTIAILPFVFFPSSLQWTTQLHKDGMSIAGSYLYLWGFLILINVDEIKRIPKQIWLPFLLVISGALLSWASREDYYFLLLGASIPIVALLFFKLFVALLARANEDFFLIGAKLIIAGALLFSAYTASFPQRLFSPSKGSAVTTETDDQRSEEGSAVTTETDDQRWEPSMFLDSNLDYLLSLLASQRDRYLSDCDTSRSCIDIKYVFNNAVDLVTYLPRATALVFVAPTPQFWLGEGSYAPYTLMRRIVGVEMLVSYLSLPGIVFAFMLMRKRIIMLSTFLFSYSLAVAMTLIVPNLGTLYRVRFGAQSILIAVGIAGLLLRYDLASSKKRIQALPKSLE